MYDAHLLDDQGFLEQVYEYNNNNISFQSQASWGRLELKPTKSLKSPTWHVAKRVTLQRDSFGFHLH